MAESKNMDWDKLQQLLNNDGKISEAERQELLKHGIPDLLLSALEDGVIDAQERTDLLALGLPAKLVDALADGHLSDEEKLMVKRDLSFAMKNWREQQIQKVFASLRRIRKDGL